MTPRNVIIEGDSLTVLPTLDADSVDAIVTDPPYELGFMGREWDKRGVSFSPDVWREMLRVAKPGAHLLAFAGTRTFHRIGVAIEDAGWEMRDTLCWLYGEGFPKGRDIAKGIDKAAGAEREPVLVPTKPGNHPEQAGPIALGASGMTDLSEPVTDAAREWQGWNTSLKPAWEPIIVARKPFRGPVEANVLRHGTGAINIDASRIPMEGETLKVPQSDPAMRTGPVGLDFGTARATAAKFQKVQRESIERTLTLGRWPANVLLDEEAAELLDAQSGWLRPAGNSPEGWRDGVDDEQGTSPVGFRAYSGGPLWASNTGGGATRFFYTSKASRVDREPLVGSGGTIMQVAGTPDASLSQCINCGSKRMAPPPQHHICRPGCPEKVLVFVSPIRKPRRNLHPTVKPTDLMRWLVRLVTPPGGLVLDPFLGSGSTIIAAQLEGFDWLGIEIEPESVEIAEARLDHRQRGMGL